MTEADSEFVLVGRIGRPHGVRGEVVVDPESDVPERFSPGAELELVAGTHRRTVQIETVRGHKARLLVRFAGIDDRDAAEALRGAGLEVSKDRTPPASADVYYYFELMDCSCRDRHQGDLGRVVDVIEDGGGLLLEIADGERRLLVPFVRSFLVAVDRDARAIELDLPVGLIETCASRS